jgi:carboxymethylenebutenolidase
MRFLDGKVAHEHTYWDQASPIAPVGLLHPQRVPAAGEQARELPKLQRG